MQASNLLYSLCIGLLILLFVAVIDDLSVRSELKKQGSYCKSVAMIVRDPITMMGRLLVPRDPYGKGFEHGVTAWVQDEHAWVSNNIPSLITIYNGHTDYSYEAPYTRFRVYTRWIGHELEIRMAELSREEMLKQQKSEHKHD